MSDELPKISLAVSQQSLSETMMGEMRQVIKDPKYDRMYVSTLMGILAMLQHETMERNP